MYKETSWYAAAYAILTVTDIASTRWALANGGKEFNNAVATESGQLDLGIFLVLNLAVLVLTAATLEWGLRHRAVIEPRYLARPELAIFNIFYLNPVSARVMPRSVFHSVAIAPTVVGMKLLATTNNLLIGFGRPSPIKPLVDAALALVGRAWASWLVIGLLVLPVWWLALRLSARCQRAPKFP